MISLTDGTTTIELPGDLQWTDEFDWSPVEQDAEHSIAGALIIQQGEKLKGRSITLQSGGGAWIQRDALLALQAYYFAPSQQLTLSLWGNDYAVMFERPGGLKATEVLRVANPNGEHYYRITLKFIEVASE